MIKHDGETFSLWHETQDIPYFGPLTENKTFDVAIIGGGIGGLLTAYTLQKEGKKICVLESFEIGSGQTGRTTAHISNVVDDGYREVERYHGKEGAFYAAESYGAALDLYEQIVRDETIDCDLQFVNGYLLASSPEQQKQLREEFEALERTGCFRNVEFLASSPLPHVFEKGCLKFPRQLQLHPLKFLAALSKIITDRGGEIFTQTQVTAVQGGSAASVETKDGFKVSCRSIVVATNSPVNDTFVIHTKQAPYRSYVLGFPIRKGAVPHGLYWDLCEPYHYIRLAGGTEKDILIVGGEDHKTGQKEHPEHRFRRLERWVQANFPEAEPAIYRWSGQLMESIDGLPFLGHNPLDQNNVYVITGDSGDGMTTAAIGALLITDQIMNRETPWESLYNPSRFSLRSTANYLKENLNVASQYIEWLQPKERVSLDKLAVGEGMVFREGVRMVAAYKHTNGEIELMSAACPHLFGVVHWNKVEKSWDCPCHGSRFDCHGKVIEGPANQDLKKISSTDPSEIVADPLWI